MTAAYAEAAAPNDDRPVLITGGAGFIAANLAHRLLGAGARVVLFDNLARAGVEQNVAWLRSVHGSRVTLHVGDIREAAAIRRAVRDVAEIYHFAAQVAVTTSLEEPIRDFDVNARGTLHLLEAVRACPDPPPVLFTSTNKVYGELAHLDVRACDGRYEPADEALGRTGIGESTPLAFHSPYGCSKGAAEQYVLDYARTFGLRACVFRMSCIYGPHQFGTEDQGWVAHFLISALAGRPLTIYGDGHQVRDVLFVDDLVDAMLLARRHIGRLAGEAFNIGGGPPNSVSLLGLIDLIAELTGARPSIRFEPWRLADQRYYVSDLRKFAEATGWQPTVGVREGLRRLYEWLEQHAGSRVTPQLATDPVAS